MYIKIAVPDDFDPETHQVWLHSPVQNINYPDIPDFKQKQIDIWQPIYKDVLDKGFIGLIDFMGDDDAVVQAARVSYGAGTKRVSADRHLIRYLIRHRHWTPIEMCLDGDTIIPSFAINGATVKKFTIRQLAEAFRDGGKHNSWVKLLNLRTVNPHTGIVSRSKIKYATCTGKKPCYKVVDSTSLREIIVTDNHPFLRPDGSYSPLSDLHVGDEVMMNGLPAVPEAVEAEVCRRRENREYTVDIASDLGIPRSTVNKILARNSLLGIKNARRTHARKLTGTHTDPHQIARRKKKLGICEIHGCEQPARDRHHKDHNPHNNSDVNFLGVCAKHHRVVHGSTPLQAYPSKILSIEYVGERDVYDLETMSENHNFVANGFVVHNCVFKWHVKAPIFVFRQWHRHRAASINEYSGRYSVMSDDMYMPEASALMPQSNSNKQGRDGAISDNNALACQLQIQHSYTDAQAAYRYLLGSAHTPSASLEQRRSFIEAFAIERIRHLEATDPDWAPENVTEEMVEAKIAEILEANGMAFTDQEFLGDEGGLARELARIVLPVATFSEMYWKADLRNTLNFISLRSDPHAQHEIKVYSDLMLEILEPIVPICIGAFIDYQLKGRQFSAMELDVIKALYQRKPDTSFDTTIEEMMQSRGASKREITEFLNTLNS